MKNEITMWEQPQEIQTIRETFGKNLSKSEFNMFLEIGKSMNLNPFTREIYAVKYGNTCNIFVGRDGYRRVAQEQPNYDGHVVEAVYEKDDFSIINNKINHTFNLFNRGHIVGAYCEVYRKDLSVPIRVSVKISEYNTGKSVWKEKPETMIKKVAEAQALRMAFQGLFKGTYDASEDWNKSKTKEEVEDTTEAEDKCFERLDKLNLDERDYAKWLKKINSCSDIQDFRNVYLEMSKVEVKTEPESEKSTKAEIETQSEYLDQLGKVMARFGNLEGKISAAKFQAIKKKLNELEEKENAKDLDYMSEKIGRYEEDPEYRPINQKQLRFLKAKGWKSKEYKHVRNLSFDEASDVIDAFTNGEIE